MVALMKPDNRIAERKRKIQDSNLHRQCLESLASSCANHYTNLPQWAIEDSNLCSPEGRGFYRPLQLPLCQSPIHTTDRTRTYNNKSLRLAPLPLGYSRQCSRWDSNLHWMAFETIASTIGLREHASDGTRTRTCTILSRIPLPLGYTGVGASGGSRTLTDTLLRRVPLPLGYPSRIAPVGVEPTPSPYKEDALDHMSFGAARKRQESNPLGSYPSLFSRQLPTVRRRFPGVPNRI